MVRDSRGGLGLPVAIFLFLIYGAVAYWLWVLLTKARLSPDWRSWGPPFVVGGCVGLGAMLLGRLFGARRKRY